MGGAANVIDEVLRLLSDITHLQWCGQQDSDAVQTLDDLNEFLILGQVDDDDRLDIRSICHVSHDTERGEQNGNDEHDAG